MLNVLDVAMKTVRQAAAAQMQQLMAELNSASDGLTAAIAAFNQSMEEVLKERAATDKKQAACIHAMDSTLTMTNAIILSLKHQIESGEVHSLEETQPKRLRNGQPQLGAV